MHVLHLSSSDALPLIADAKRAGVRITVELPPRPDPYGGGSPEASEFKCCPPIREAAYEDLLWQADGTIDCVVTDHSPSTADLKTESTSRPPGGISGAPAEPVGGVLDGGPQARSQPEVRGPLDVHAHRPAGRPGLPQGSHRGGPDADFAVLAPTRPSPWDRRAAGTATGVTAYAGRTLSGVVKSTWLRGERIVSDGEFGAPGGELDAHPVVLERHL